MDPSGTGGRKRPRPTPKHRGSGRGTRGGGNSGPGGEGTFRSSEECRPIETCGKKEKMGEDSSAPVSKRQNRSGAPKKTGSRKMPAHPNRHKGPPKSRRGSGSGPAGLAKPTTRDSSPLSVFGGSERLGPGPEKSGRDLSHH